MDNFVEESYIITDDNNQSLHGRSETTVSSQTLTLSSTFDQSETAMTDDDPPITVTTASSTALSSITAHFSVVAILFACVLLLGLLNLCLSAIERRRLRLRRTSATSNNGGGEGQRLNKTWYQELSKSKDAAAKLTSVRKTTLKMKPNSASFV